MHARLEVKIPSDVKSSIEYLSRILGVSVSDIIRDIVIPITRIKLSLEAIETIETQEKMLVKAIIQLPEFQKLLEKLYQRRFQAEVPCEPLDYCIVDVVAKVSLTFKIEKWYMESYGAILYVGVDRRDGKYYPTLILEDETKPVEMLYELYVWLKVVADYYQGYLESLIEDIRKNIERLTYNAQY